MGSSITHYQPPQLQNHTDALGQALSTPCKALHQYAHSFRDSTRMPAASETAAVQCNSPWPELERRYHSANTFGPVQLEEGQGLVQGRSLKNVSLEAINSSVFLRNQQQTKSLTWLSAPSCQARWPQISQWNLRWWAEAVSFWCLVNSYVAGFKHQSPAQSAQQGNSESRLKTSRMVSVKSFRKVLVLQTSEKYFNCLICISNFQMAQADPPQVRPTTWCFVLRLQMLDSEEVCYVFHNVFKDTQQASSGLEDFCCSYGVLEGVFTHICWYLHSSREIAEASNPVYTLGNGVWCSATYVQTWCRNPLLSFVGLHTQ